MKPAFSYNTTFVWFVIVFSGMIMRNDFLGVTSIVRALLLPAACYTNILHFFHSTAWSTTSLLLYWMRWVSIQQVAFTINNRIVLIGDHTKTPKDGRKMPALTTLHQESESASKPSFFRGHEWGFIALLIARKLKFFATPMMAEIHNDSQHEGSRIERIVKMAERVTAIMKKDAYLVLDAFFSVGPTFDAVKNSKGHIHILTRAKKNVTAYTPAEKPKVKKRGRPRIYGQKLKLMELFDSWNSLFQTEHINVYGKLEPVKYLTLDLMWKPTKSLIRFFLFETSRGRIILMTTDFNMTHETAMKLYCHRVTIEILFDVLKNTLGGLRYHFWSKYIVPASRRPKRGKQSVPESIHPEKTAATQRAIEKFVNLQVVVLGILQLLALEFPQQVIEKSLCWLRTSSSQIPSEFVTKMAISNLIRTNLASFGENLITHFIRKKQQTPENSGLSMKEDGL